MNAGIFKLNRRDFLQQGLAAGGGLALGVGFTACSDEPATDTTVVPQGLSEVAPGTTPFSPNAFVRIDPDNTVTVIVKHTEVGQGIFTGLSTLVAEELDADWAQIRAVGAPADSELYRNLNWGSVQGTGGSSSMNNAYLQMRRAGATARAMLVGAAAKQWEVRAGEIEVASGIVRHVASGQSANFGDLAAGAAQQAVPENVALKAPDAFVYIGRDMPRTDKQAKTNGSAVYTQDFTLPGMLTALVEHPPRFGAHWKTFDASAAEQVEGVEAVLGLATGIAVVAKDFWSAKKGRDALRVEWDERSAFHGNSDEILAEYRELAKTPGQIARRDGDVNAAFDGAAQILDRSYEFPYLAHATMEPMNCVAQVSNDGCELWYGAQIQTGDQNNVAHALDIEPQQVRINMLYAGGSFGRRAHGSSDYVVEAARIAQGLGGGRPVKLVWTREDDMRAGAFRPLNHHRIRAALDRDGAILAWQHRIVGQSVMAGTSFAPEAGAIDKTTVQGGSTLPYAIPNIEVDVHNPDVEVPVLWWRSVGHSHTAFSSEVFFDELAHAAGADPLALRLALLAHDERRRQVIELAARQADWSAPLPAGRGRGIAVHEAHGTYVAQIAEVSVLDDDSFAVDKVTIAVDCGMAVNPDIVRAQMEGGMGFGLSTALGDAITLKDGIVEQDNFDTYQVLRMSQMPEVAVHIVASTLDPTGVGESGVPCIAPAVANALFAATGMRRRRLPLNSSHQPV